MFASALLMGMLWGLWHFVLFCEGDSFSGALPLALLLVRLFGWLSPYRMLMVWVYEHTRSLLLAMLMHVSLVASNVFIFMPAVTGAGLLIYLVVWGGVLWLIATGVASAQHRQSVRQPLQQQMA